MNTSLQESERDEFGQIRDPILQIYEASEADSLRAKLINCMCINISELGDISLEALNADLPHGLMFKSLSERIERMACQTEMVGELEIIWTSKAINRQIHVIAENNVLKYGEACQDNSPLTVRYTKLGEDVGHYDSLVCSTAASECITPMILSPLPKIARRKRTKRMSQAEALTSTPYKTVLANRKRTASKRGESKRPAAKRELAMKRRQTKVVD